MGAHPELVPSVVDRIKCTLVGLRMPRALEIVDAIVRQIERGEVTALEAIDAMLIEEFTPRENRRIKTALVMARLSTMKTLAGFDFAFQPSLDRNRILAFAELQFINLREVVHFVEPPGTGESHLSIALGIEAVKAGCSVHFLTLADLVGALAKAERDPLLPTLLAADCGRNRLSACPRRWRQPVLPTSQRSLRARRHDLTSSRGFAEWGEVFGDPMVATALLDGLLHHAVVVQIESASYRLRQHADLVPEHIRSKALIHPQPVAALPRRRGRPPSSRRGRPTVSVRAGGAWTG